MNINSLKIESSVEFVAAAKAVEGETVGPRKFAIEAYTGAAIKQNWSAEPIVIDLAGMKFNQRIPIVLGHDYQIGSILGQTTSVRAENGRLYVEGEILASNDASGRVVELADKGFAWQASVGADVMRHQRVPADQSVTVNGQVFNGPIRIVKASKLREVSFVTLGADDATSVSIAADAEEIFMAEANEMPEEVLASSEATAVVAVEPIAETVEAGIVSDSTKLIEELTQKVEKMEKIIATRDERLTPAIHVNTPAVPTARVIEAAFAMQCNLPNIEKHFDVPTLEAAARDYRHTSLGEVLVRAAQDQGYTGSTRLNGANLRPVMQAAWSTHTIADILSATYGKFLLNGFSAVESTWDQISSVRSVNDFKSVTSYRLNGGFDFDKVAPGGELKSASASDEKRTLSADTYGIMSSITRTDLVNDDLGALSAIPSRIGRGAAIKLNKVFWAAFSAATFATGSAGAGNALAIAGLKLAVTAFRKQTDTDGNPLAIAPAIILVPVDLEIAAAEIMGSSLLISGNTTANVAQNVLAGRYRVVSSSYLSSATSWWLAADPQDLPAMEVAFLNGQRSPTVETADADFNVLGIQMRGYFDFGCAQAESKGAYKMAVS
jgi:phage major head subunit gpT-like protein